MFYNVILAFLIAYAVFAPCIFIKFGMNIAEKTEKKSDVPIFNIPTPKKKPETTLEERREIQKWQNIMRYDGTSAGQVKISEVK